MKYFTLLTIILCGCKSSMMFENHTDNSLISQLDRFDTAKLFFKLSEMPKPASAFLKRDHIVLADTGKSYNKTDLNFDYSTPNARIIFGGWLSQNLFFVMYESQGIATQSHLLVFKRNDNKTIDVEQKFIDCRPSTFSDLKKCIN